MDSLIYKIYHKKAKIAICNSADTVALFCASSSPPFTLAKLFTKMYILYRLPVLTDTAPAHHPEKKVWLYEACANIESIHRL